MGFISPMISGIGSTISAGVSKMGSLFSSGIGSLTTPAAQVYGPQPEQSVFSKIGNVVSSLAPYATSIYQAKTSIDSRTASFEEILAADLEYNKLAIQADAKAREEAKIESDIVLMDALEAAQYERDEAHKAAASQKMSYLKSGVLLDGSPLIVVQDTYDKGKENYTNVLASAKRKADLITKRGDIKTPLLNRASINTLKAGNTADLITAGAKLLDVNKQVK